MIEIYDDILKEELAKITPLDRATSALTDEIDAKINAVMKQKGITKSQLAKMAGQRASEVTKWLWGKPQLYLPKHGIDFVRSWD